MILFSLCVGVMEGWLEKSEYENTIERAYEALETTVWGNGMVSGICIGTGVFEKLEEYERRPTDYFQSSPGSNISSSFNIYSFSQPNFRSWIGSSCTCSIS